MNPPTPVHRDITDALLRSVCAASRLNAERRATLRGDIPADVRWSGLEAERLERYEYHYGQAPDLAMLDGMLGHLRYLVLEYAAHAVGADPDGNRIQRAAVESLPAPGDPFPDLFPPDEIVVGPGGQTLAESVAAVAP